MGANDMAEFIVFEKLVDYIRAELDNMAGSIRVPDNVGVDASLRIVLGGV